MVEVIIAACGGAAVGGVFSLITWGLNRRAAKKDKKEDEAEGVEAGVQILLYDRIKYLACKYIDQGWVSTGDLEDLERMHKIYHDKLHGNGFLDELMEAVRELPKRTH